MTTITLRFRNKWKGELQFSTNSCLGHIKDLLAEKTGIPREQILILSGGKCLQSDRDAATLAELGMKDRTAVYVHRGPQLETTDLVSDHGTEEIQDVNVLTRLPHKKGRESAKETMQLLSILIFQPVLSRELKLAFQL